MTILLCYDCLSTRKKWSKSVSTCVRWWLSLEQGKRLVNGKYNTNTNTNGKYKCDKLSFQTSWRNGADPVWRVVQADWGFDQQVFFEDFLLFKSLTNKLFLKIFFFLKVWPTSVLGSSSEPESTGLLFSSCQDHMKYSDWSTLPGTHCGREKTTKSWSPW